MVKLVKYSKFLIEKLYIDLSSS